MESFKQKGVLFLVFFGVLLGADFDTNNSLIEFYGKSDSRINIVDQNIRKSDGKAAASNKS